MANLLQEIEAQIAGLKVAPSRQNVGMIREIGDGVAKVEGLSDAMLNEMLDLGHGITGLALNLEETEVGVIVLGDYTKLARGRRSSHHWQASASTCRQRSAGARREYAWRACRRQRADQEFGRLSG